MRCRRCYCCGTPSESNISLIIDHDGRIFIPNQDYRDPAFLTQFTADAAPQNVWLCRRCMRVVEDNLRATIGYLRHESRVQQGIIMPINKQAEDRIRRRVPHWYGAVPDVDEDIDRP